MPAWLIIVIAFIVIVVVVAAILWFGLRWRPKQSGAAGAETAAATKQPYGPGSAAPLIDGSGPVGFTVKGNADSMLYHTTDSPYYERTKAEAWFRTEEDAAKAGFKRWDRKS